MSIAVLIKKNADAPVLLATSGVTGCFLNLRANGVDSLTFTQSADWLAAPAWPFGTKVCLILRDSAAGDTCVFVGTVETIPRQAEGGGPQAVTYTALGPAYDLQLCDYMQEWAYTTDAGVASTIYEPTVVLGEDNNGTRLASGGVINHAAAYAVSRGVAIDIDTIAAGVTVPFDERDNIKVWDAVVAMLRYTPDYVLWWDYNHTVAGAYVPALNVTDPAAMTAVSRALVNGAAAGASFTPRYDIRVPGLMIIYRWTGDYDGRTVKSRVTETAGSYEDPRRVALVYDLDGLHATFIKQEVEVSDYPADWTSSAGKAFLAARIPWLSQLGSSDWTVSGVTRSGSLSLPAALVSGAVPEWTGEDIEPEVFTATVNYVIKSTESPYNVLDQGTKKLTFTALSTDATTKTYKRATEWVEPEPVPTGMAAALYASWNRLHYDGQVTFHGQECDFGLGLGQLLSCTGGMTEWETMAAVIQDVTYDIGGGKVTVKTGTCGRLEADNLMSVYRAARGRRYSYRRLGRDSGDSSDGNLIDGAFGTPNDSVADGTPACLRKRFAVEAPDSGSRTHLVDINPAAIAFATAGNAAALNISVIETLLPVETAGKITGAKRAQVLACAPYGDEVPLEVPEDDGYPSPGIGESLAELPAPPDPVEIESITWIGGEPIIDLNSGGQQDAPVRLSAVLPLGDYTFYPCKFIAARFPDKGEEDDSLGIVRGLDTDQTHPLKARLAGVDAKPAATNPTGLQRVYGFSSAGHWGLFELESLFKYDATNKRFYMDLAGYTGFKSLSTDAATWGFNADANLDGKNGATFDVVTDVAWDSTNNKLVIKKRTVTLFKFGLSAVTAASPSDVIAGEECEE